MTYQPQLPPRKYTRTPNGEIAVPSERYPYAEALPVIMGDGMVRRMALELANDIIADARNVEGPVVWVTGNSYVPPLRSFPAAESVWDAANNEDGELFAFFAETLETALNEAEVYMAAPEHDNALYVVDLKRWQYNEDAGESAEDMNDEWERIPA